MYGTLTAPLGREVVLMTGPPLVELMVIDTLDAGAILLTVR